MIVTRALGVQGWRSEYSAGRIVWAGVFQPVSAGPAHRNSGRSGFGLGQLIDRERVAVTALTGGTLRAALGDCSM